MVTSGFSPHVKATEDEIGAGYRASLETQQQQQQG